MSPIKEAAIKIIQEMPEESVVHVLRIISGVKGLHQGSIADAERKKKALKHLQQFRGRIPASLDYDAELTKSRTERYARTN